MTEFGKDAVSASNTLTGASSFTPPPTTSTPPPTTTTPTVAGQLPPPTTTTTTTTPPLQIALNADPNPVDFGQVAVGIGSPIQTVTITNVGTGPGQVFTELGGSNPDDFFVARNGCNEVTLSAERVVHDGHHDDPARGGLREASLILDRRGRCPATSPCSATGHFVPQLIASPGGDHRRRLHHRHRSRLPAEPDVRRPRRPDATSCSPRPPTRQGQFQIPLSAIGKLSLGNYVLRVDAVPDVFDLVQGQLVVVLPTFEPQGPGGAAFGDALIVTRGS